ncbi:MAG: hypothetical protein IPG60_03940 [Bacteroidetes bacterium]|nr:hypothetical protein [Bacteroidota bacterium]
MYETLALLADVKKTMMYRHFKGSRSGCHNTEMLLHHKNLYAKVARGQTHKANAKKPKDYGINTKPTHKAIIYSVSFWFFYPPCCEEHINYFIMQNHPRISAGSQLGICPFTPAGSPSALALSPFAYQRYIRRSRLAHQPVFGIKVYQLPCGCFVWCYPSGVRELSALPF